MMTADNEIKEKFTKYLTLLLEQGTVHNLTAVMEPEKIDVRHFEDSMRVAELVPMAGKKIIDVGAGAGFPGIPIRLMEPSVHLTLLDATMKKIEFLQLVCEELGLSDVICLNGRAEELSLKVGYRDGFDIAIARGVANLNILTELCLPLVRIGGFMIAMKKAECQQELKESERAIKTLGGELDTLRRYTLSTGEEHALVMIRKVSLTPNGYPRRYAKIKDKPL